MFSYSKNSSGEKQQTKYLLCVTLSHVSTLLLDLRDVGLIPLKSGMKPHFHTEGDHSSVFAERMDLNSAAHLNYADPLSAMPKTRSQKNLDRMLISVYTDACNFCGSAHLTCAIGMRCPSGNKCIWTWQPSSCLNCQTFRLILPLLCWSINSRQEIYNEGSYGLHQ